MRQTAISRTLRAGCFTCHDGAAHWFEKNAAAVAARHHDATGHPTWVEVSTGIYYGREKHDEQSSQRTKG